jgi:hypothetical protein
MGTIAQKAQKVLKGLQSPKPKSKSTAPQLPGSSTFDYNGGQFEK